MKIYPATSRVNKLRETAFRESLVHPLPLLHERIEYNRDDRYGWDDRMLMWFYEAWEAQYKQPTTLLRRYAAEADMIAQMPVFLFDDDLICGRSDMRPLNESERRHFEEFRMKNVRCPRRYWAHGTYVAGLRETAEAGDRGNPCRD